MKSDDMEDQKGLAERGGLGKKGPSGDVARKPTEEPSCRHLLFLEMNTLMSVLCSASSIRTSSGLGVISLH